MKKITSILVAGLLCVATTLSAQFTNSTSSNVSQGSDVDGWSGIRVSYSPMKLKSGDETEDLTGLSLGFVKGFGISQQSPVFIETGANFQWSNLNRKVYGAKVDYNVYSINIPLNIGYKYAANEGFSIFPYAGINLRGNIAGKGTASYNGEKASVDLFDKDDMEDGVFNRFQVGWQIGVGVNFSRFYLSASYGTDFSELADELKISSIPSVTVGINF